MSPDSGAPSARSMAADWKTQAERGSLFWLLVLVRGSLALGRAPGRIVLCFIALYYLIAAPRQVSATRDFLHLTLRRKVRRRDVYRVFFNFASTILDRVFLFSGQAERLTVTSRSKPVIRDCRDAGQGAIVMVSHLGSYEVLRILGTERAGLPLRVLMDRAVTSRLHGVMDAVNPRWREIVIDTSESDFDRALKVKDILDRGGMVGLTADRYAAGERVAQCNFLGRPAAFPLSPWLLAGLLRAPVFLAFGIYLGGNHYRLYFERLSARIAVPRRARTAAAQSYVQRYADRLAYYADRYPYNWFNFYDFWAAP